MGWQARLALDYRVDDGATRCVARHDGPLRVLKSLYPEGPQLCQNVIVHPPSGIVGGDEVELTLALGEQARVLITTPGAARFYRSNGPWGEQRVQARLAAGSRLEWLPQETLVYRGARARSQLAFTLDPGAEMIGCDLVALGLPEADAPFDAGVFEQVLSVGATGQAGWLDRGRIAADDHLLLDSPLGLDGCRCWGVLWCASGTPWADECLQACLGQAREIVAVSPLAQRAGVSAVQPHVIVLRVLGDRVESVAQLLRAVRRRWRRTLWGCDEVDPRLWAT